ncbi:MAG: hypothetical protein HC842_06175, partial [Cytophagales bacterium]|nr:hypothetical protein [Cytophagales bacterium]
KQNVEKSITLPALGDFSVLESRLVQDREQYLLLVFSDPLHTDQNLNGLVSLSGVLSDASPRLVRVNNHLKIYPTASWDELNGVVKVSVASGLQNLLGKPLAGDYLGEITLSQTKPAVELEAKEGVIMAGNKQAVLPFRAIGLKAVEVTVIQLFENNILQYLQVNDLGGSYDLARVGAR